MNNDAFQKMVRERAGGKSTKEIAREAVEAEFQRKRKRGGRGGSRNQDYDSDSDDEGNNKHSRGKKNKVESSALLIRPQQVKGKANDDSGNADDSTYRDRAKERREGTTVKPETATSDDTEMDLIALSNKKGLDFSLLKNAKQELDKQEPDFSSLTISLPTFAEALLALKDFRADPDSYPTLHSGVSGYLVHLASTFEQIRPPIESVVCGVAGRNLQRSRLAMSMEAYPSNHSRAWEAPREMSNPSATTDKREINFLDNSLLRSIDYYFSGITQRTAAKPQTSSRSKAFPATKAESSNVTDTVADENPLEKGPEQQKDTGSDSQDDDDDIFGGLDDYVPPKPKE